MCLDPVTMGLIGTAVSAGTGILGANQTAQGVEKNNAAQAANELQTIGDNTASMNAGNAARDQFMTKLAPLQAAGQEALQPEYAALNPATFEASRVANAGANTGAANSAIDSVLQGGGPQIGLTNTDGGQSANAIKGAVAGRTQLSRDDAAHYANLASYGNNFANFGNTEMNTNEGIDENNQQARALAAILPTDQANAELQARKYIPPTDDTAGNTQIGVGNLLASNAGGIGSAATSLAKGLGSVFSNLNSTPSVSNPSLSSGSGGIGMA